MITWHLDRFIKAGPLLAVATFLIPFGLALLVAEISDVENILGLVLVSALVIFIGTIVGSIAASAFGVLLFGLGSTLAEISAAWLCLVGITLFVTMVLHDLAGSFHRAPSIAPRVWKHPAIAAAAIAVAAAACVAVAYLVATAATWRSIVVPFGIAGLGLAVKLAADGHATAARQLTAKRQSGNTAND